MIVYVYKEYNDEYAYGEEIVKVYAKSSDAIAHLKERVLEEFKDYGRNIRAIKNALEREAKKYPATYCDFDIGEEDANICVPVSDSYQFFIVEKHDVA